MAGRMPPVVSRFFAAEINLDDSPPAVGADRGAQEPAAVRMRRAQNRRGGEHAGGRTAGKGSKLVSARHALSTFRCGKSTLSA